MAIRDRFTSIVIAKHSTKTSSLLLESIYYSIATVEVLNLLLQSLLEVQRYWLDSGLIHNTFSMLAAVEDPLDYTDLSSRNCIYIVHHIYHKIL
jgi:hypothetical protein